MNQEPEQHPLDRLTEKAQRTVHPLERRPPEPSSAPPPPDVPKFRVEIQQHTPILAYILLGLNILVFFANIALGNRLVIWGVKDNFSIINGQYWRLVTPIFLHAGFLHLGLNSYFLYIFGPQTERMFGGLRFTAIYLLSGIAGVIASFALIDNPSLGASGALFGLVGAQLVYFYRNRSVRRDASRQLRSIAWMIGINLFIGFSPIANIDNWGHIGGLIGGMLLAWFSTPIHHIHEPMGDLIRIEDKSSPAGAWLSFVLIALALAGLTQLLIILKS
jgi:rhomboid protease GluP